MAMTKEESTIFEIESECFVDMIEETYKGRVKDLFWNERVSQKAKGRRLEKRREEGREKRRSNSF